MSDEYIEAGLSNEALHVHRALASLQEELQAIDYYHQRVDVTVDDSLKAVLAHNRDDEMEHAAMLMEWLRRAMPTFEAQMRKFLFTSDNLVALAAAQPPSAGKHQGLGLGNLK